MKATKQQLIEEVNQLERKYENLVWYARKSKKDREMYEAVRAGVAATEKNYPIETEYLKSPQLGDWQHGFNSGMLAGMRFVDDALNYGIEDAYDSFPNLNS
jgi:hypothetical protein